MVTKYTQIKENGTMQLQKRGECILKVVVEMSMINMRLLVVDMNRMTAVESGIQLHLKVHAIIDMHILTEGLFPVSQTAQRIAGLKTYMRDELGLEGVVTGIQKPFETLAARANQNPNGRLYRAAPMVFDPIGLVAEGMLRLVGRAGLIEQMYPDQAESKTRSVPSPETG